MFVLGLQGSPRNKGNSHYLLTRFMEACQSLGAETQVILTDKLAIQPCRELIVCEKKGFCPLKDEMETRIYGQIRQADVVVLASPVFFYNVSAQVKILIDRCQMFWGRKYKLGLKDPDAFTRKGVLMSVAASGGKRLFEGVELTAKYFFDAISADFAESLTYKKVEAAGAIAQVPGVDAEIRAAAQRTVSAVRDRKTILFVSQRDTCLGPMAAAYAKMEAGADARIVSAGLDPAEAPDPAMEKFMAEESLDLKYHCPTRLSRVMTNEFRSKKPDKVVCLGVEGEPVSGVETLHWDLDRAGMAAGPGMKKTGALLKEKVAGLVRSL